MPACGSVGSVQQTELGNLVTLLKPCRQELLVQKVTSAVCLGRHRDQMCSLCKQENCRRVLPVDAPSASGSYRDVTLCFKAPDLIQVVFPTEVCTYISYLVNKGCHIALLF